MDFSYDNMIDPAFYTSCDRCNKPVKLIFKMKETPLCVARALCKVCHKTLGYVLKPVEQVREHSVHTPVEDYAFEDFQDKLIETEKDRIRKRKLRRLRKRVK